VPGQYLAVVTGSSSGIGLAACRRLRQEGWRVVGMARRRSPAADLSLSVDVADAVQVEAAFAGIDPPRLVLHAAGVIGPVAPLVESSPDGWRRAVDIDLLGLFHVLRFALPRMSDGHVVHVTSGAASHVNLWWSAYSAAKAGAEHLVRCAAAELDGAGVGICALSPGITETAMQEELRRSDFPDHGRFVATFEEGRSRAPDEVVDAVLRLAARPPGEVNGKVFTINEA
jgi:3-oxoacyl-[acyl-carrier protein] reductase